MRIKLKVPYLGFETGYIMTVHPLNARTWYKNGICEALTPEENEFLKTGRVPRTKSIETAILQAEERTIIEPTQKTTRTRKRKTRKSK